jgi:hypothetical protein
MTKKKVVGVFTWIALIIQVAACFYGSRQVSGEHIGDFLEPLGYSLFVDLLLLLPVIILTIIFMVTDKGNRQAYIPYLIIQIVFTLLAIPIVFVMLTP